MSGLTIDGRTVAVDGSPVQLTNAEHKMLTALAKHPARVFTKDELLRTVYNDRTRVRALDATAATLRTKLGATGRRFVINIWGVGYRLTDD